jgi:hypothetical protein
MHPWLQQGLLYCCCLRLSLFPRRPVRAGTALPMMAKRPLSEAASGCRRGPFWTLRRGLYTYNGSSAAARVIERILRINRTLQILTAIRG